MGEPYPRGGPDYKELWTRIQALADPVDRRILHFNQLTVEQRAVGHFCPSLRGR